MADLVKIIDGTEVGSPARDYSTLQDFEDAYDGVDWSSDDNLVAQIRNVPTDSSYVIWNGWSGVTQSSSHRLVIEAYAGDETDGKTDDYAGGRIEDRHLLTDSNVLYQDWKHLEFHVTGGDALEIKSDGGGEIRVAKCMFRDSTNQGVITTEITSAITVYVGGCLFKGFTTSYQGGITPYDADSNVIAVNCTFADCENGMYDFGGTSTAKNCAATNNSSDITVDTETTCLEEGNAEITNDDADDFTEPSTDDYTVYDTDSNLYHTGTAEAGSWFTSLCSVDFSGTSWASPPSVGCFEFPEAAGARRIIMSSTNWRLFAFMPFLIGTIKNPFLKRRDFFNPKNWMKK